MATRATYEIEGKTFYCHWDGYPAGAMDRLSNMVAADTGRGGLPFAFIRGNFDAEPADSHDHHGDTEFRYLVYKNHGAAHDKPHDFLTIYARCWTADRWQVLYGGFLHDCINLFAKEPVAFFDGQLRTQTWLAHESVEYLGKDVRAIDAGRVARLDEAVARASSRTGARQAYDIIRHAIMQKHINSPSALHAAIGFDDPQAAAE
jgi:hypothetical protein